MQDKRFRQKKSRIWRLSAAALLGALLFTGCGDSKSEKAMTCTFGISCETLLNNMDDLKEGKETMVPKDGVILAESEVTFYEGETVFDVLLRETKENKIHMEYAFTPGFNSNYIEGINNLYEFDCGPNSGWTYCVNGEYPNYGCSGYEVKEGDVIEWKYTCDGRKDLGSEVYK